MKNKNTLHLIAIASLFMVGGIGTYENPAVQSIIDAWPSVSTAVVRMLITVPSILSTIAMIFAGQIVGKKLKFKTCNMIGTCLLIIGGILPFFLHTNFKIIMLCRIVLGIGAGLVSVRNSLLILSTDQKELARLLGLVTASTSLTTAVLSPIVGWLTKYGWEYAFLPNAIAIIPLFCVLFLEKDPEILVTESVEEQKSKKIPALIYGYLIASVIVTMALYPLLSGIATYFSEIKLGNATIAGVMLSTYTGSGIISNVILDKLENAFKEYLPGLCLALPTIGLVLITISHNIWVIGAGVFISGFGFITFTSITQYYCGIVCDPQIVSKVSTLLLGAIQVGMFLSSYYIELCLNVQIFSVEMKNVYIIGAIIYFIFTVGFFAFKNKMVPDKK